MWQKFPDQAWSTLFSDRVHWLCGAGGLRINDIEAKYYADSEDAYDMRKMLKAKPEKSGGIFSLSLILLSKNL
jgi:hypothetical protein